RVRAGAVFVRGLPRFVDRDARRPGRQLLPVDDAIRPGFDGELTRSIRYAASGRRAEDHRPAWMTREALRSGRPPRGLHAVRQAHRPIRATLEGARRSGAPPPCGSTT